MPTFHDIPVQKKLIHFFEDVPVEWTGWNIQPDHYQYEGPHRHDFYELMFFQKGEGIHEIEFNSFEIKPYSIHFIPRSAIHQVKKEGPVEGYTLSFDEHFLNHNHYKSFRQPLGEKPFVVELEQAEFEAILTFCRNTFRQLSQTQNLKKASCFITSVELILNWILGNRQKMVHHQKLHFHDNKLIDDFVRLVKQHIHEKHSVRWYANQLHVSAKHLSNRVCELTETSAKRIIINTLLSSVKVMLRNTSLTLGQIALTHNMSPSKMSRLFKHEEGQTMSTYRRQQKGNY